MKHGKYLGRKEIVFRGIVTPMVDYWGVDGVVMDSGRRREVNLKIK